MDEQIKDQPKRGPGRPPKGRREKDSGPRDSSQPQDLVATVKEIIWKEVLAIKKLQETSVLELNDVKRLEVLVKTDKAVSADDSKSQEDALQMSEEEMLAEVSDGQT